MWVPQFIKAPGQDSGAVDDRNWEQVDLLPTVADLAGIQVPWKMEGSSQTGQPTRTRTEKWWYDIPGRRQVRDGPSNWTRSCSPARPTPWSGAREGVRGLYRYGASADLIYHDPASVGPIGGDPEATAVLDDFQLYTPDQARVGNDPGAGLGQAHLAPPGGATVLVAVNGKIGGESRLFSERPGEPAARFAVITPDFLWKVRRRPPPAPGLRGRPERRPAPPAAGQPVGRVAAVGQTCARTRSSGRGTLVRSSASTSSRA